MPTYIVYTLQHAIYLAKQIESQIKLQRQRNFDDVIKRFNEIQSLIKEWHVSIIVSKDALMSSTIVEEENSCAKPKENV